MLITDLVKAAAPPADTIIRNRAIVSYYTQNSPVALWRYSNEVEIRVEKVEGLSLRDPNIRAVPPGQSVTLPHTLTNTGNTASTYQFTTSVLPGCFGVSNVRLIYDANNNGVADVGEAVLPLNGNTGFNLPPLASGASVSLVLLADVPTTIQPPAQCKITLTATSALQGIASSNTDTINVSQGAAFSRSKSSNKSGEIVAGEEVAYSVQFSNVGNQAAVPLATLTNIQAQTLNTGVIDPAGVATPLLINGVPATKIIMRDIIPKGSTYVSGSLSTAITGAQLLYRRAGDPPFSYQTTDQSNVVEVAIALDSIGSNTTVAMNLKIKIAANFEGAIENTAELFTQGAQASNQTDKTNIVRLFTSTAPGADLVIDKFHAGDFTVGAVHVFTIQVDNVGQGATTAPIVVTDTLPVGMSFAGASGVGWSCSGSGQIVTCSYAPALPGSTIFAPSRAAPITLQVLINPSALAGQNTNKLINKVRVDGGGEVPSRTNNNEDEDEVTIGASASIKGTVWHDTNHDRKLQSDEKRLPNWQVQLVTISDAINDGSQLCPLPRAAKGAEPAIGQHPYMFPCMMPVKKTVTDGSGNYVFNDVPARSGYSIVFKSPQGYQYAHPVNGHQVGGGSAVPGTVVDSAGGVLSDAQINTQLGVLYNFTAAPGVTYAEQSLPVDYGGVVYDSITREPVKGATVRIFGPAGFAPVLHLIGGASNEAQITTEEGLYQFALSSFAPPGRYTIAVSPPPTYSFPSVIIPPQEASLDVEAGSPFTKVIQAQYSAPTEDEDDVYYLKHDAAPEASLVVNNHIPIDPPFSSDPWVVSKEADKSTVEVIDFVHYKITLTNETGLSRREATIYDQPPAGFTYVKGSAFFTFPDGKRVRTEPEWVGNGKNGRLLKFNMKLPIAGTTTRRIKLKESFSVSYRMAVNITALQGTGINTAWAESRLPVPTKPSNRAKVTVKVTPGVFTPDGYAIGNVFLDCNKDGMQQADEQGVPGIRIYMEDGRFVVTDQDGRFSLYGLSPTTHVLKIDDTTAPKGAVWGATSGRNSDLGWLGSSTKHAATSHFLDLKNGEAQTVNFALQNCGSEVQEDIAKRAKSLESLPQDSELAALTQSNQRFNVSGQYEPVSNVQERPSAGVLDLKTGQIKSDGLQSENSTTVPQAGADLIDNKAISNVIKPLEEYLTDQASADLEVINLKEGQVLPYAQTNVQVKGKIGHTIELIVNNQIIPNTRIGKRSSVASKEIIAFEYIAVTLQQGRNEIVVVQYDSFGVERDRRAVSVIAPGKLAQVKIEVDAKTLVADGQTPVDVKIKLVDDQGVLITSRTPITLSTGVGQLLVTDLSATEDGIQTFIQGGEQVIQIKPPIAPSQGQLMAVVNDIKASQDLRFSPKLRPMIAVGVVDGAISFSNVDFSQLEPVRKPDAFDQELTSLSGDSNDGKTRYGARAAFFLKGQILGKYLLTAAYDSNKTDQDRLFRDVQPDEYYPVYGDDSVKGFEAQSSGRLYVRIDKERSYALYGDFTTQGDTVRQLTQYSRGLNGAKVHIEEDIPGTNGALRLTTNVFTSKGTQKQIIEKLRANGTSGPFELQYRNLLENAEQIEVAVYDRFQPNVQINDKDGQKILARFVDYSIDYETSVIRLKSPLPSFDLNGNPVYLKVNYEVKQGGDSFVIRGADVQVDLNDKVKVGVMAVENNEPSRPERLRGIYAQVKPLKDVTLTAEKSIAIQDEGNGVDKTAPQIGQGAVEGAATRLEAKLEQSWLSLRAQLQKSDPTYEPINASLSKGRQEGLIEASSKLSDTTTVKVQARQSKDTINLTEQNNQAVSVVQQIGSKVNLEAGLRSYKNTVSKTVETSDVPELTTEEGQTARLRASAVWPYWSQLSSFVEYERDLDQTDRELGAVGTEFADTWGRIYARHEFLSSLGNPYSLTDNTNSNKTMFGFDAKVREGTNVYTEYRKSLDVQNQDAQSSTNSATNSGESVVYGLRQKVKLSDRWSLNGTFERTNPVGQSASSLDTALTPKNTAISLGADYAGLNDTRLSSRIEKRRSDTEQANNIYIATSYRLRRDLALLLRARYEVRESYSLTGSDSNNQRYQIGLAYRPKAYPSLNVLTKLERKLETTTPSQADLFVSSTKTWIASTHATWQPLPKVELTGRFAAKYIEIDLDGLPSDNFGRLLFARARYDLLPRWDVGVHGFVMTGKAGAKYKGVGVETGFKFNRNVWLSVGYNRFGFNDADLAGPEQTSQGTYLRLRVKFDENGF